MIVPYSLSLPLSLSLSRSLVLTLPRSLARSLSGLAQASVGAHVPPQGRSHALDGLRFNEDHIVNDHLDHPLSDHTEISATERPCRLYHPIPPSATTQETPHTALEYTRQPACRGLRFGVRRRRCVTTREVACSGDLDGGGGRNLHVFGAARSTRGGGASAAAVFLHTRERYVETVLMSFSFYHAYMNAKPYNCTHTIYYAVDTRNETRDLTA